MSHLTLELLLWILLAFFVGCVIGCLARRLLAGANAEPAASGAPAPAPGRRPAPEAAATPMPVTVRPAPAPVDTPRPPAAAMQAQPLAAAAPTAAAEPHAAVEPRAAARKPRATGRPVRPAGIAAPRGGVADNLQQISGVGPKIERTLNGLGVYHFDQIAAWTPDEAAWADAHLKFRGRMARRPGCSPPAISPASAASTAAAASRTAAPARPGPAPGRGEADQQPPMSEAIDLALPEQVSPAGDGVATVAGS